MSPSRRPVSLRLSVTDRCSLRCIYCMPPDGVKKLPHFEILSFEEMVRFVSAMRQVFEVSKVHLTGGEPLIRKNICELVSALSREGVSDIALTTNGQCLAELAAPLKAAGLTRVNVSLDSLDGQVYSQLTRGGVVEKTLEGITEAARARLRPIKLNVIVLRGYNVTEIPRLVHFAFENQCHIRFLELMPIGVAAEAFERLFVPMAEIRERLEKQVRLSPLAYTCGHSSQDFSAVDLKDGLFGTVGFIAGHSQPFCNGCSRMRLTSTGQLITCLASGASLSIGRYLRSGLPDDLRTLQHLVDRELDSKCARGAFITERSMVHVGG